MQQKKFGKLDFKKFHPSGNLGKKLRTVEDLMSTKARLSNLKYKCPENNPGFRAIALELLRRSNRGKSFTMSIVNGRKDLCCQEDEVSSISYEPIQQEVM